MSIESDIYNDWIVIAEWVWNLTLFDLDKIPEELDEEWTKKYLLEKLNVDEIDLDFINDLYDSAITYMQSRLFFTEQELSNYKWKEFDSILSVIKFIVDSKSKRGRMNCSICKMVLAFLQWASGYNPRIDEVREKTAQVVENKLIPPLQILEQDKQLQIYSWVVQISWRSIPFTMRKRVKTDESRISKWVRDSSYHEQELLSDWYWVTFELDNKEDIPVFMEYIAGHTFKKWIYDIKQKNMFSQDEIWAMGGISDEFRSRLMWADWTKKEQTADWYSDIKIVTPYYKDDTTKNMSMEIKFVVSGNSNENGLAMQWVYDYFKRIEERIRLDTFVTPEYISNVVEMFFYDLESILIANIGREDKDIWKYKTELFQTLREEWYIDSNFDLRNSSTQAVMDTLLKSWLISYYKDKLRAINVEWLRSKKVFYTLSRSLTISELWIWKNRLISLN